MSAFRHAITLIWEPSDNGALFARSSHPAPLSMSGAGRRGAFPQDKRGDNPEQLRGQKNEPLEITYLSNNLDCVVSVQNILALGPSVGAEARPSTSHSARKSSLTASSAARLVARADCAHPKQQNRDKKRRDGTRGSKSDGVEGKLQPRDASPRAARTQREDARNEEQRRVSTTERREGRTPLARGKEAAKPSSNDDGRAV